MVQYARYKPILNARISRLTTISTFVEPSASTSSAAKPCDTLVMQPDSDWRPTHAGWGGAVARVYTAAYISRQVASSVDVFAHVVTASRHIAPPPHRFTTTLDHQRIPTHLFNTISKNVRYVYTSQVSGQTPVSRFSKTVTQPLTGSETITALRVFRKSPNINLLHITLLTAMQILHLDSKHQSIPNWNNILISPKKL